MLSCSSLFVSNNVATQYCIAMQAALANRAKRSRGQCQAASSECVQEVSSDEDHANAVMVGEAIQHTPEEALLGHLLHKWGTGKLEDKELCELAHYITQAGGRGVNELAVRPGIAGYNHKRRIRTVLVDKKKLLYFLDGVPMWS